MGVKSNDFTHEFSSLEQCVNNLLISFGITYTTFKNWTPTIFLEIPFISLDIRSKKDNKTYSIKKFKQVSFCARAFELYNKNYIWTLNLQLKEYGIESIKIY